MAEAILFGVAQKMIENLGSQIFQEIGLLWGVKDELQTSRALFPESKLYFRMQQSSRVITIKSVTGLKSSRMQFMMQMTC